MSSSSRGLTWNSVAVARISTCTSFSAIGLGLGAVGGAGILPAVSMEFSADWKPAPLSSTTSPAALACKWSELEDSDSGMCPAIASSLAVSLSAAVTIASEV